MIKENVKIVSEIGVKVKGGVAKPRPQETKDSQIKK